MSKHIYYVLKELLGINTIKILAMESPKATIV